MSLISSISKTVSNISDSIQDAGASFAKSHPTAANKIYNTTNQAASTVRSVTPSISDVDKAGYEAAEGGYESLSAISKKAHTSTRKTANTIRAGVPVLEKKLNSKVSGSGTVIGYPVRSTANLIEMGGMVPGGVETMARNPGVIVPAVARGGYDATIGTGKAFAANPAQTTSDIATAALFFGGAARVGPRLAGATRAAGTKVPRMTRTKVAPDILIKGEIPLATAPKAPTKGIVQFKGEPTPGAELSLYKPRTSGKTPNPPSPKPNFFIGKKVGPTAAEGYIRVPGKMAKQLQKEYEFSNVRQVTTDYGSFVELEGIKPRSQPKTSPTKRITQAQDRAMLGELPKGRYGKIKNPYRIEHKLKIEPADLETGSSLKSVPGNIIEVNAKAFTPKQITGGVRDPFRFNEFMTSEKATVKPTTFKDPVREMFPERMFEPQPQFKRGGQVALKERGNNVALNDIQNIFERSKAMHEAEARINVRARPKAVAKPQSRGNTGAFPAFSLAASGTKPASDIFISARSGSSKAPKTKDSFTPIITPMPKSKASPLPDFAPSVTPSPKPAHAPAFGFDEFKPTAAMRSNIPAAVPYVKPKGDRRVSKKKHGKRSADYYQVTNPIKDIAELMKQ